MNQRVVPPLLALVATAALAACSPPSSMDAPAASASATSNVVVGDGGIPLVELPSAPIAPDNAATCDAYLGTDRTGTGDMLMAVLMVAAVDDLTLDQADPIVERAAAFGDASDGAVRAAVLGVNEFAEVRRIALRNGNTIAFEEGIDPAATTALIRACAALD